LVAAGHRVAARFTWQESARQHQALYARVADRMHARGAVRVAAIAPATEP
jgi:hypothetical protein